MAAIEEIQIDRIRLDGGTQPRAELIQPLIHEYVEALTESVEFPPVIVFYDGQHYWLADGYHRIGAFQELGFDTIPGDLRQGTLADAVWFSCGANSTHGQRQSNKDKRRAVETALRHMNVQGLSNREIAKHCGVSHTYVAKVKSELGWHDVDRPDVSLPVQEDQRAALEAALTLPSERRRSDDEIAETFGVSQDAVREAREKLDAWVAESTSSGGGGGGDPREIQISAMPERDAAPKRVIKLPRDPMQAAQVILKNFGADDIRLMVEALERGLSELE